MARAATSPVPEPDVYKQLYALMRDEDAPHLPVDDTLVDVCRVLNPNLPAEQTYEVVAKMDVGGKGGLTEDEFLALARTLCFRLPASEAVRTGREIIQGLKDVRRRRFLMFSDEQTGAAVNQEELALRLAGGRTALALYEELFVYGLGDDASAMAPAELERLLLDVCPTQPARERKEMLKIAHLEPATLRIDFNEFLILMRGARLPTPLSEMVQSVRDRVAVGMLLGDAAAPTQPSPARSTAAAAAASAAASPQRHRELQGSISATSAREAGFEGRRRALLDNVLLKPSRLTQGYGYEPAAAASPAQGRVRAQDIELDLAHGRAEQAERRAVDAEVRAARRSVQESGFGLLAPPTPSSGGAGGDPASLPVYKGEENPFYARTPQPAAPAPQPAPQQSQQQVQHRTLAPPPPPPEDLRRRHQEIRASLQRAREGGGDGGDALRAAAELDQLVAEYDARLGAVCGAGGSAGGGGGYGGGGGGGGVHSASPSPASVMSLPSAPLKHTQLGARGGGGGLAGGPPPPPPPPPPRRGSVVSRESDSQSTLSRLAVIQAKAQRTSRAGGRWKS